VTIDTDCFMIEPEYRAFMLTGLTEGKVCELGCKGYGRTKDSFTRRGWSHTSIDLNGLGGALPLDLTDPIDIKGIGGPFDVVTNFGTSEHVEGQEACWRNIFRLCKAGGYIVCCVPWNWPKHGKYYPSVEWYRQFGDLNDMQTLSITYEAGGKLIASVFKKLVNGVFKMPDMALMKVQDSNKVGAYAVA
jgi:SAM-dependent methyltransferase